MVSLSPLILTSKKATNYKIQQIKTLSANKKRYPRVGLWQRCLGCFSHSAALFFRAQALPQSSFQRRRRHMSRLSPADERDGASSSRTGQEDQVGNPRRRPLMTTSGWQIEEGSNPGETGRGQLPVSRHRGGLTETNPMGTNGKNTRGLGLNKEGAAFVDKLWMNAKEYFIFVNVFEKDRRFWTCSDPIKPDVQYTPVFLSSTADNTYITPTLHIIHRRTRPLHLYFLCSRFHA